MTNLFEAKNIHKQYAGHKALDGVSIQVPEGSIYGLLGPNGAGKTTFIRIINQITAPDSGNITFNGEPLQQKHIAQIGYLPEERGLYKKMKVGEQALYLAQLKGLSKKKAKEKTSGFRTGRYSCSSSSPCCGSSRTCSSTSSRTRTT